MGAACLQSSLQPGVMKGLKNNNNNKNLQTRNNQRKAKHGYLGVGEALLKLRSAAPRGCKAPCLPVALLPCRHRHPEAGGSPGGEPVERHLPVPVQR